MYGTGFGHKPQQTGYILYTIKDGLISANLTESYYYQNLIEEQEDLFISVNEIFKDLLELRDDVDHQKSEHGHHQHGDCDHPRQSAGSEECSPSLSFVFR